MIYCGKVSLGEEFLFRLVIGKVGMSWTLFTEYTKEDRNLIAQGLTPEHVRLDWRATMGNISSGLEGYIETQAICNKNSVVSALYGNDNILQTVMQNLAKEVQLNKLTDSTFMLDLDVEAASGFKFIVLGYNEQYNTVTRIRGLKYLDRSSANLTHSMKRTRILTFEQIKAKYDLSWAYDELGRLKKDYRIINDMQTLSEVAEELSDEKYHIVTIDTESTGTEFFWFGGRKDLQSKIVGMSLTWKIDQAIYIPFMSNLFAHLDPIEVMDILYPILKKKYLIPHNGLFDARVFYSLGYYLEFAEDTMLMEFNLDPFVSKGSKGLKMMTRFYFGHETLELDDICGGVVDGSLIPDFEYDVIKLYACADTDYVFKLKDMLTGELRGSRRRPYELDNKAAAIVGRAEFYGAKIDMQLLPTLSDINQTDLLSVEALMWDYLQFAATQIKAKQLATKLVDKPEQITKELLDAICADDDFKLMIKKLLSKQTKKSLNKHLEPLQFSSSKDLNHLLFSVLDYPITRINKKSGAPMTDADVLDDLMSVKTRDPVKFLREDLQSSIINSGLGWKLEPEEKVIISKEKFEGYAYPFAYLLSVWRGLNKLRTSFFDKLLNENTDGWYTTTNSMTSAETARIINPVQTLIGYLKRLVIPYGKEWYMCVFDFSQIEFRLMIGLACQYWEKFCASLPEAERKLMADRSISYLITKLNNPESDYHREGGSVFAGTTPEDMTSDQRHKIKAVHFAVPYGAQEYTVAAKRLKNAHTDEAREHILSETRGMLGSWEKNMYPLYKFLEIKRDMALIPVPDEELPPRLRGTGSWGRVSNALGRCRYFNLNFDKLADDDYAALNATERAKIVTWRDREEFNRRSKARHIASIRRQAGNYPIQSFARELFVTANLRLQARARKEGLIADKEGLESLIESLYVHDETVLQVMKNKVHPYKLLQMISEECMLNVPGHPRYYCGIAVVNNWYEGKSEKFEIPVECVLEKVAEYKADPDKFESDESWKENPRDFMFAATTEFMMHRIAREIKKFSDGESLDMLKCLKELKNYFVLPRLKYYTHKDHAELESFLKQGEFLPVVMVDKNGEMKDVNKADRLKCIQFMDVIANSGDFSEDFNVTFEGKDIPVYLAKRVSDAHDVDEEEGQTEEFTEGAESFDASMFDDIFSDFDDDKHEKELMYSREYNLLSEEDMSMAVSTGIMKGTEDDFKETYVNKYLIELPTGQLCLDVTNLKKDQFAHAIDMLRPYFKQGGKQLVVKQGITLTTTNQYVVPGYDDKALGTYISNSRKAIGR